MIRVAREAELATVSPGEVIGQLQDILAQPSRFGVVAYVARTRC